MKIIFQHNKIVKPLPEIVRLAFTKDGRRIIIEVSSYEDLPIMSATIYQNKLKLVPQILRNRTEKILYKAISDNLLPLTLTYYFDLKTDTIYYIKFDKGRIIDSKSQITGVRWWLEKCKKYECVVSETTKYLLKKVEMILGDVIDSY